MNDKLKEAYLLACDIIDSAVDILPETYQEDLDKLYLLRGEVQDIYDNFIETVKDEEE